MFEIPAISQWEDDDCLLVVNGRTLRRTATALKMFPEWKGVSGSDLERSGGDGEGIWGCQSGCSQKGETCKGKQIQTKQQQRQQTKPTNPPSREARRYRQLLLQPLQMGQDKQTAAQREDRGEEDLRNHTEEGRAYPKRSNTSGRT